MKAGAIYRKVDPSVWDDEKFIGLGDDAQSLFLLLLTGPQTCSIPGLQLADVYTLASARRWDAERVKRALDTLSNSGMVELDARLRVLRLPNAPKYNGPDNPSVLLGWWKEYQRLPNSELKRRHVASIKAAVAFDKYHPGGNGKDPLKSDFRAAWNATFGAVEQAAPHTVSVDPAVHPVPTPCLTSVSSDQGAVNSEQQEKHSAPDRDPAPAALELLAKGTFARGKPRFDFEAVYVQYPRKEGKAEGLKRLQATVKTPEQFVELQKAIANFTRKVTAEGTEQQFIPHFSTWANGRWRDYVDEPHIVEKSAGARAGRKHNDGIGPQPETREEEY